MPPTHPPNPTAPPRPFPLFSGLGLLVFLIGAALSLIFFASRQRIIESEIKGNFSRQVQSYLHALRDSSQACGDTLESIRTLLTFSPAVTRAEFQGAAILALRRYPSLQAVEWSPSVSAAERLSFENAQRASGLPDFNIYERIGDTENFGPAPAAEHYLPILYTEPATANAPALGYNLLSGRASRLMAQTIASRNISLGRRVRLRVRGETVFGLIVYLPVYQVSPVGAAPGAFRGMITGAVRLDSFLAAIAQPSDGSIPVADVLLIDRTPADGNTVLGLVRHHGPGLVENLPPETDFSGPGVVVEPFDLWRRSWELRFRPNPAWLAAQRGSSSWLLLTLGLLTSGALGLVVHTRSRRTAFVENQVEQRTAELHAAQSALADSDERYRAFISQSAEPIWRIEHRQPLPPDATLDQQLAHILAHAYLAECNDAMAQAYGRTHAAELVGTPLSALLDPRVPQNQAFLRAFLSSPDYRLIDVESHETDLNGQPKIFLNSLTGIVEQGRLVRSWGTQRDITARRQTEIALAESRRLLDSMMDQLPGMSVRCTASPGYPAIYISRGVENLTGHVAEDFFSGRVRYADLIHADDRPLVWPAILAGTSDRRPFQIQYRIQDRQAREHWVLEVGHGLYDAGNQLEFIDSLTIDITAQKLAESEKLTLERKLAEGQKLESLGVLAGGIAHDFNNLLTAILGHASLARLSAAPGGASAESLGQIELAARRAAELCQQMLAYAGKSTFTTAPVDLGDLVRGTVGLLEVSIGKNIRLALNLAPGLPPVLGDATQLRQIIMNLVLNAADAIGTAPSGCIELTTAPQRADRALFTRAIGAPDLPAGDYTALEIRDNGQGMSPALLARIFEPFFTTKFAGRGLGLSAVLGIVQGHRGALCVASSEGEGTVFRLLLPSIAPVAALPEPPRELMTPKIFQGRSVLVIDDEPTVRQITTSVLKRLGVTVHSAASGDDAVVLLRDQPLDFDLALLDLTMPGLSGEETLRILHELRPALRVILMSGYSESDILRRLGEQGAVDFLQKPFELELLHAKLSRVFNLPPA